MKRVFLSEHGEIVSSITADPTLIALNTPEGAEYIDTDRTICLSDYWNGSMFVSIGEPPSLHHTFDYTTKQWLDVRTIYEIKEQKWKELKIQRDKLEFGGFEFDGGIYDSDQVSQGRIMGAVIAGVDQIWTLADNTTVELSASQLQQLYAALQAHIASAHERGRIARQLIFDAENKEEVEAIQL